MCRNVTNECSRVINEEEHTTHIFVVLWDIGLPTTFGILVEQVHTGIQIFERH